MKPQNQPGQKSALRDDPVRLKNKGTKLNQCKKWKPAGGEIHRKIAPEKMAHNNGKTRRRKMSESEQKRICAKMAHAKEDGFRWQISGQRCAIFIVKLHHVLRHLLFHLPLLHHQSPLHRRW